MDCCSEWLVVRGCNAKGTEGVRRRAAELEREQDLVVDLEDWKDNSVRDCSMAAVERVALPDRID